MITPTKKQFQAICSMADDKIILHTGAVRSGKTVSVCFALPILVERHRAQEGLAIICTKSLRNTELNILAPARNIYGEQNIGYVRDKSYVMIFREKFYILPFNDERSHQKIQGLSVKLCIADELVLAPESFFTMLLSRLSLEDSQLVATMNPGSPTHYLKRYMDNPYIDEARTVKKAIWQWRLEDNPTLDKLYVSGIKEAYRANKSLYKRLILGEWTSAEGLAYFSYTERNKSAAVDMAYWRYNAKAIVLGVDPANLRDSTGASPLLVDYQDRGIVLQRFVHNPKNSVQLSNVEQIGLLRRYINDLALNKYENLESKIMIVDCAAADFILRLRNDFPDWQVISFTKKNIQRRLDVSNNKLADGDVVILAANDYDYYNDRPTDKDRLLEELQNVTIKDNADGQIALNPAIENDVSDSWSYATTWWYKYRIEPNEDEE